MLPLLTIEILLCFLKMYQLINCNMVILLAKYTTITVRHSLLRALESIRKELKAKSLGEAINILIKIYREYKSLMFAWDIESVRKEDLGDLREVIDKIRRRKWAKL